MDVFKEIQAEREYQDNKWGHEFDDENTINDWGTYINIYLAKATDMSTPFSEQRGKLLKVAALAVAAIQTFDRNEGFPSRHYD